MEMNRCFNRDQTSQKAAAHRYRAAAGTAVRVVSSCRAAGLRSPAEAEAGAPATVTSRTNFCGDVDALHVRCLHIKEVCKRLRFGKVRVRVALAQ